MNEVVVVIGRHRDSDGDIAASHSIRPRVGKACAMSE